MCGLTGTWSFREGEPESLARDVAAMTEALVHRGPDDRGTFVDSRAGLALGHRRLSILDLSEEGHQPMRSADGRYVLVYNGEVYNFRELAARLEGRGVRLRGQSDTEAVLESIVVFGLEDTLRAMAGMFAFALWDAQERRLVLGRDRLGIKPLYWGIQDGRLLFASELKALRANPSFRVELDRDALALYMRHNYIPAPHAIYRDVRKLQPGRIVTVRAADDVTESVYWDAREVARAGTEKPLAIGADEARERLDATLRTAVERRMIADVPLGAFLSGGIDSSLVVALMQRASTRPVRTFTIGFDEEGYDEAGHARAIATHLGTDHTELYVRPEEAREVIPKLPDFWDEPFSDSSQIPTYLVSKLAREHVTVALSGDGGDELFGGYPRYALARKLERYLRFVPGASKRALASALQAVSPRAWEGLSRTARAARVPIQPGWMGNRASRMAELLTHSHGGTLYRTLISHWKEPAALVIGAEEPETVLCDRSFETSFPDGTERMMLLDSLSYLPDDILCKVDRASMATSLEARVPLLDHEVFELAWRMPRELRIGPAPGKRLLREVLATYVPRELFERPKMGFGIPIGAWMRGPLRPWCEELLSEARLRREEFFVPGPIRQRWQEHVDNKRDWAYYLWDVLVFQAWAERWLGSAR